jgi:hypothetical protein
MAFKCARCLKTFATAAGLGGHRSGRCGRKRATTRRRPRFGARFRLAFKNGAPAIATVVAAPRSTSVRARKVLAKYTEPGEGERYVELGPHYHFAWIA